MRRALVSASIVVALVGAALGAQTTVAMAATTTSDSTASTTAGSTSTTADQGERLCPAMPEGYMSCLLETAPLDDQATSGTLDRQLAPQYTASSSGLTPADFRDAYSLGAASTAAPGSGPVVALIEAFDAPNLESDLAQYRSAYGLGTCSTANGCFRKVTPTKPQATTATDRLGWAQEATADVEMVSAICPQCGILVVEANSSSADDLGAAVNTAVKTSGAKYVSNSYGGTVGSAATAYDTAYFKHAGVVVTASSGDAGYEPGGAIYPASSPWVTSVGGTTLGYANGRWQEAAWSGSGSGCATVGGKPTWQTDSLCARRTSADVSAVAYGIATFVPQSNTTGARGTWMPLGGTSLSSPIIAAVYALAGTPKAGTWPSQYPYQHASALRDITSGANGSCSVAALCRAAAGYDAPTGLGSPNGLAAFRASTLSVSRVAGTNAYDTAAQTVALGGYSPGLAKVYVATRSGFPDALAGGAAAGADGAPILLVTATSIPSQTAAALKTLRPQQIVVLGGTTAISKSVANGLKPYTGSVARYAGANRWATSAAISSSAFASGATTAYIATGTNFPDALSGAALAATSAHRGPILLVPGTSIPDVVSSELARLRSKGLTNVVVLGGTSVVSTAVSDQLARYGTVSRLAGTSRFGTSAAISKAGYASAGTVYVATGTNFPDALAGAPVAARVGAPVLLVTPGSTPSTIQTEIDRLGARRVVILGGTAAVGAGAQSTL